MPTCVVTAAVAAAILLVFFLQREWRSKRRSPANWKSYSRLLIALSLLALLILAAFVLAILAA